MFKIGKKKKKATDCVYARNILQPIIVSAQSYHGSNQGYLTGSSNSKC
jgi:hypothetical protein